MFTCPYCNQSTFGRKSIKFKLPFDDWKSVRFHASNCKKNDNSFVAQHYVDHLSDWDQHKSVKKIQVW